MLRIGELAEKTQTPADTIRYYERSGLLPKPLRTAANYRAYSTPEVERLQFIRRCRGLDMSINEIRSLLVFCDQPQRDCTEVNSVLDKHIRHVDDRIEDLQRLARELKQLRAVCRAPGTAKDCRILKTLRSDNAETRQSTHSHSGRSHVG